MRRTYGLKQIVTVNRKIQVISGNFIIKMPGDARVSRVARVTKVETPGVKVVFSDTSIPMVFLKNR